MATALSVINRAFRLMKVKQAAQTLAYEDAQDALSVFNGLLAELYGSDIQVPDYSIATLQTDLSCDAADEEALAYALAQRLWPEYKSVPMSAEMVAVGSQAMDRLRLRYFQPGSVDFRELPGCAEPFDFTTG